MIRRRKIVVGVIACAFAVLMVMLAAVLLAPSLIDTKSVKDEIRSHVQKELGAKIDFKHLVLDLFPHPHVIFNQATLSISRKAVSVSVYPKILPLFLGKMQIASLRLDSAELDCPRLNVSANLALTQSTPLLSLQVKGTQIDVAATRQAALTLSGKNKVEDNRYLKGETQNG